VEAGGRTLGVACDIFDKRAPNSYLTTIRRTRDLHQRQRELIDHAEGFVILEGQTGTLSELALLWALHRAGCLERRPVVLLGGNWKDILIYLERNRILGAPQMKISEVVETARAVLDVLAWRLQPGEERA
jgi:predicted Rossmann-fold nucleotide-binding protein